MSSGSLPLTSSDLSKKTKKDLVDILKQHGQSLTGNKAELVQRIKDNGLVSDLNFLSPLPFQSQAGQSSSSSAPSSTLPKFALKSTAPASYYQRVNPRECYTFHLAPDFLQRVVGPYETIVNSFVEKSSKVIKGLPEDVQKVNPAVALCAAMGEDLFKSIIRCTSESLENDKLQPISPDDLRLFISIIIRLCLDGKSPQLSYDILGKLDPSIPGRMSFKRVQDIMHHFRAVPGNALERRDDTGYVDLNTTRHELDRVIERLNEAMRTVVPNERFMCVDDDHITSKASDMHSKDLPRQVSTRKGEGFSLHTLSGCLLGVPNGIALQDTTRIQPYELLEKFMLKPNTIHAFDRGYMRKALAEFFKSKSLGILGILADGIRYDHPVSVIDSKFQYLQNVGEEHLNERTILSFPGVGLQEFYWKDSNGGYAVGVVNRTKQNAHCVLRFLFNETPHCRFESISGKFVGVPGSIHERYRIKSLCLALKEGKDAIATELFDKITPGLRYFTLQQGSVEWLLLRRTGLTATMAEILVKDFLRFIGSVGYQDVRQTLYKDHTEASATNDTYQSHSEVSENNPPSLVSPQNEVPFYSDQSRELDYTSSLPDHDFANAENQDDADLATSNDSQQDGMQTSASVVAQSQSEPESAVSDQNQNQNESMSECQRRTFDKFVIRNFVQKYPETDAMHRGKQMETRAVSFVEKRFPFVAGSSVYLVGLAQSLDIKYAYDFKDGVFLLDCRQINPLKLEKIATSYPEVRDAANNGLRVPCGLEIKTSQDFSQFQEEKALDYDVVIAGSPEYHAISEIKSVFKLQLLHQAFVGNFKWILLSAWSKTNSARTVLIYYPTSLLLSYGKLLKEKYISEMFEWFEQVCHSSSATDGNDLFPEFMSKAARMLISTNVPLLSALYKFAIFRPIDQPMEPLHTIRTAFVMLYDFVKGATDVECRVIADAWRNLNFRISAQNRFALRLVYHVLGISIKVGCMIKYHSKMKKILPPSFETYRKDYRNRIPMNDLFYYFAEDLQKCPVRFGAVQAGLSRQHNSTDVVNSTEDVKIEWDQIVAAEPEMVKVLLHVRAEIQGRNIDSLDFIGNTFVPAADSYRSRTTPTKAISRGSDNFDSAVRQQARAFRDRPNAGASREKKWSFWKSKEGQEFRWNTLILHQMVFNKNRPHCFSCQGRPQEVFTCVTCGENFCLSCFAQFHERGASEDAINQVVKRMRESYDSQSGSSASTISRRHSFDASFTHTKNLITRSLSVSESPTGSSRKRGVGAFTLNVFSPVAASIRSEKDSGKRSTDKIEEEEEG